MFLLGTVEKWAAGRRASKSLPIFSNIFIALFAKEGPCRVPSGRARLSPRLSRRLFAPPACAVT